MFLSITSVLPAALGRLGWQALQQELSRQRIQERVEAAAGLITAALQKDLSKPGLKLREQAIRSREGLAGETTGFARSLPDDSVLPLFDASGAESLAGDRHLFS